MLVGGFIPFEVIVSVNGAMIVAIIYLARQLGRANERISRLEGRLNGRPRER